MATASTAKVMTELSKLLEINLEYFTFKQLQTVGSIGIAYVSLEQQLGFYDIKIRKNWHTFVDIVVYVHNASRHAFMGCTTS